MYLREWLAWCGIGEREMGRRLGIAPATVNAAIVRGSVAPAWLAAAAQTLGVPPAALATHPLAEEARPWRARVLIYAARRRLREAERRARP